MGSNSQERMTMMEMTMGMEQAATGYEGGDGFGGDGCCGSSDIGEAGSVVVW